MKDMDKKKLIVNTMYRLLESTSIDDISVKEICKRSGVSRSTFYRCFRDKYAIINWEFVVDVERIIREIGRTLTWHEAHVAFFKITRMNKGAAVPSTKEKKPASFADNHRSMNPNSMEHFNYRRLKEAFTDTLVNVKHKVLNEKLKFQIEAFSRSIPLVLLYWGEQRSQGKGIQLTIDEKAELLDSIVPAELKEALELDK